MEAIGILAAALVAVVGWGVNAELQRRDLRRRTVVEFLLSAYRRLEAASNRPMGDAKTRAALEAAYSDVVLLGAATHVRSANDAARQLAEHGGADFGPLLKALRFSLRQELRLEEIEPELISLRMGEPTDPTASAKPRPSRR